MMEVRPILPNEIEPYLRVLCSVFELDLDRARGIILSEPLFDLRRKWAAFAGNEMVSILSTVPLEFGWGRASGVASVATPPQHRRRGYASCLIEQVMRDCRDRGELALLLFARDPRVYSRLGFKELDRVVSAPLLGADPRAPEALPFTEIQRRYDGWAEAHPNRLRRDPKRWQYWRWSLRVCHRHGDDGYACAEGSVMREHLPGGRPPIGLGMEWSGLESMAEALGLELGVRQSSLALMGWGVETCPEMFLTDQF